MSISINELVTMAGENSRDHGFHEDWPVAPSGVPFDETVPLAEAATHERQLQLAIVEKLALIHEEISEALGEIRSGHHPLEVYYRDDGKPEGLMVELADAVIRIADLAFLLDGDLEAAIEEKHAFNATRPHKHGRQF